MQKKFSISFRLYFLDLLYIKQNSSDENPSVASKREKKDTKVEDHVIYHKLGDYCYLTLDQFLYAYKHYVSA